MRGTAPVSELDWLGLFQTDRLLRAIFCSRGLSHYFAKVLTESVTQFTSNLLVSRGCTLRRVPGGFEGDCDDMIAAVQGNPVLADGLPGFRVILRTRFNNLAGEAKWSGDFCFRRRDKSL